MVLLLARLLVYPTESRKEHTQLQYVAATVFVAAELELELWF